MRVAVVTGGSRGDVQPYIALSKALNAAGHQARLVASVEFGEIAAANGIEFAPYQVNIQEMLASDASGQDLMNSRQNPMKMLGAMKEMMKTIVEKVKDDLTGSLDGIDLVVSAQSNSFFCAIVAEKNQIPLVNSTPVPVVITGAHPSPLWVSPRSLGSWYNRQTGRLIANMVWRGFGDSVNDMRRYLGLLPITGKRFFEELSAVPTLVAVSPTIYERPADYPATVKLTGYWFLDEPHWTPPTDLLHFLDSGTKPVYIGFGSMTGFDPNQTTRIVLEAVRQTGVRAVIGTGYGGITQTDMPDNVYVLSGAPHSWLFPHMAAVVHHGGAGTTAAGLRAGVPSVIVPFIADQPFWGNLLARQGVAPRPLPRAKLTAEKLASALKTVTNDGTMQDNARRVGERIRAEDGLGNAVRLIERAAGKEVVSH
jgi:sterol 3beta-glucosyltransferase